MSSVLVLLSTFNGEKYIEQQLNSLLEQHNVNISVLVRDDGSLDKTCMILDKWKSKMSLEWYSGNNIGWRDSFMDLLYSSGEYDYYAFCDQDDVWLPNKLSVAIQKLEAVPMGPKLYFSNIMSWDGIKEQGLAKSASLYFDKYTCLVQSISTGNTMVFNKPLRDIICLEKHPQYVLAHDYWVFKVATLLGRVYYDPNSYILYRQHGDNQVGVKRTVLWNIRRKVGDILKLAGDHRRQNDAKMLLTCYGHIMDDETYLIVRRVAEYRKNIIYRFNLLFSRRYVMDTTLRTILLKHRVLIGRV